MNIYKGVCETPTRRLLIDNNIIQVENGSAFNPLTALDTAESRQDLISRLMKMGYRGRNMPVFSQIKHKANELYRQSGWKYAEELLDSQRLNGGVFYCLLIEMGEMDLYSKETAARAKAAVKAIVGSFPAYWKVERTDSEKSLIHVHIITLAPHGHVFSSEMHGYTVLPQLELSSQEKYKTVPVYKQVYRFIKYLLKPADARALKGKGKGRYVAEMYFDYWQNEINKHTGKGTLWEKTTLRGALNMSIKWLDSYTQDEIESRYEDPPILPPFTHPQTTPAPKSTTETPSIQDEVNIFSESKLNISTQIFNCGFKGATLEQSSLGNGAAGVFYVSLNCLEHDTG